MAKPIGYGSVDFTKFRLTPLQAGVGVTILALIMYGSLALEFAKAKDFILPGGALIGGDFVAFWGAAKLMAGGMASEIYDPIFLPAKLMEFMPSAEDLYLTWQYPPTYFFAVSFLAFLPYGLGYAVWTGGSFAIFAATIRSAGVTGIALLIVLAAPATFHAIITGQNGFLTASLLMGAALYPDKRPAVAGLCAALLTMKPQLGVLIPFAFIAGGYWRAFSWAAAGSLMLGLASIAVFGFGPWIAFVDSIFRVSTSVSGGALPLSKMPTVFAAFKFAGAPDVVAQVMQGLSIIMAVWATVAIWRRYDDRALRAGVVCVGAYFVSPYLFHYELVILAAPIALLALQAREDGWRRRDRILLTLFFLAPLFIPNDPHQNGFNLGFVVTVFAFIFVLRRMQTQSLSVHEMQRA